MSSFYVPPKTNGRYVRKTSTKSGASANYNNVFQEDKSLTYVPIKSGALLQKIRQNIKSENEIYIPKQDESLYTYPFEVLTSWTTNLLNARANGNMNANANQNKFYQEEEWSEEEKEQVGPEMQKIYTYLEHVYNSKMDYKFNQSEKKQRYEFTNRHVRDYDGSKSVADKMMTDEEDEDGSDDN